MPTKIGWRQSKKVRTNIMSLLEDILKENNRLMTLQHDLLQKQLVESGAIDIADAKIDVNLFQTFEKENEIKECEKNITENTIAMKIALLDDSDLIFMNFDEFEDKINECKSDIDICNEEIGELKGEMEEY